VNKEAMERDEYMEWLYGEGERDHDLIDTDEGAADLAGEREQVLEAELYLDDYPEEKEEETEADSKAEQTTVRHEMLKTAISRLENAARTQKDFENVVVNWDKLDQNEARRLRNHEVSRGNVPLEFDKAMDGVIVPFSYMEPHWTQVMSGCFLEVIHDCPFELDELVSDPTLIKMLRDLKDDYKEIFYWHFIRQLSCVDVGRVRNQTDRNIRKTRAVILRKLRKQLQMALNDRQQAGYGLTLRQREFLAQMEKDAIDADDHG
jgi:hypothetical protein